MGRADDRTTADDALRRIRAGESLLYGGDFRNARQLLAALGRRLTPRPSPGTQPAEAFRKERHRRREAHLLLQLSEVTHAGSVSHVLSLIHI